MNADFADGYFCVQDLFDLDFLSFTNTLVGIILYMKWDVKPETGESWIGVYCVDREDVIRSSPFG